MLVVADGGHGPNTSSINALAKGFTYTDLVQVSYKQKQFEDDGRGRGRINLIENVWAFCSSALTMRRAPRLHYCSTTCAGNAILNADISFMSQKARVKKSVKQEIY